MKEPYNHIDEFLKKSVEEFQAAPSPGVWQKINLSLTLSGLKYYLIIIAFLTLIVSGYLVLKPNDVIEGAKKNQMQIAEEEIKSEASYDELRPDEINSIENRTETVNPLPLNKAKKISSNEKPKEIQKIEAAYSSAPASKPDVNVLVADEIKKPSSVANNHYKAYPGLLKLSMFPEIPAHDINVSDLSNYFDSYSSKQLLGLRYGINPNSEIDYVRVHDLYFGLQAGPEWIFTNDPDQRIKKAVNIDASLTYKWKDNFIQGGIGVALSEDNGLFEVNYSQYDSIGFYYQVNGFTIDPATGQPVYKTTIENVFDTVNYIESAKVKNNYTYLRIPIYYGFEAYQSKRFSLSLKGGVIYAIMIDKNEPNWSYQNTNAHGIEITNNTKERIRSNLQFSLGVGMDYSISNRMSLSFDPLMNYYMSPIYNNRYQLGNVWSLGFKAGLLIKL